MVLSVAKITYRQPFNVVVQGYIYKHEMGVLVFPLPEGFHKGALNDPSLIESYD